MPDTLDTSAGRVGREFAFVVGCCIAAWMIYLSLQPFAWIGEWAELWPRLEQGLFEMEMERWLTQVGGSSALGFCAAVVTRSRTTRALVVLVLFCGALELAQGLVEYRHARLGDLVLRLVSSIGAFAATRRFVASGKLPVRLDRTASRWSRGFVLVALIALGALPIESARQTNLRGWDLSYPLVLGNEATGDRTWRGTIYALAIYESRLSVADAERLTRTPFGGPGSTKAGSGDGEIRLRKSLGAVAQYLFMPPLDGTIRDLAGDLHLERTGTTQPDEAGRPSQSEPEGLVLGPGLLVRSLGSAASISSRIAARSEFSVEILCRSASPSQTGPARIASVSIDPFHRNFTVAQEGDSLALRVRSPAAGENGNGRETHWPGIFADSSAQHLVLVHSRGDSRLICDRAAPPRRKLHVPYVHPILDLAPRPFAQAILLLLPIAVLAGFGWSSSLRARLIASICASVSALSGQFLGHLWSGLPFDPTVAALAILAIPLAAATRRKIP